MANSLWAPDLHTHMWAFPELFPQIWNHADV